MQPQNERKQRLTSEPEVLFKDHTMSAVNYLDVFTCMGYLNSMKVAMFTSAFSDPSSPDETDPTILFCPLVPVL